MKRLIFSVLFLLITLDCEAEPVRIVSLAPNVTEILFVLDLEKSIIAVDEYSNYPERARGIERIGAFDNPNIERIILLRPDYILVNADMDREKSGYLERLGISIIKVAPESVDGLCEDIKVLGGIFNKKKKADLLTEDIRARLKDISGRIRGERPKVFVQLFDDPLITASSFIGDIIRLAGGRNVAWDVRDDSGIFSYEVLIDRDPDIMIIVGFSKESGLPGSIGGVRNRKVVRGLDPDVFLRPGPRAIEAIEELNRIFYEKD